MFKVLKQSFLVLATIAPFCGAANAETHGVAAPAQPTAMSSAAYAALPLSFEPNRGQAPSAVLYQARYKALRFEFGRSGLDIRGGRRPHRPNDAPAALHMRFVGTQNAAKVSGERRQPGVVNYFAGQDRSKWISGVTTYSSVKYHAMYPGVDLSYYGSQGSLEYDFIVAGGADPSQIQMAFPSGQKTRIGVDGALEIHGQGGSWAWKRPVAYQIQNGKRALVSASFRVQPDHTVGFKLGAYDPRRPLIIDPVLAYSTYLGGSDIDTITGIDVDRFGCAYICGFTDSTDFPKVSGAGSLNPNGQTGFVTKLNAAGTGILYTTFVTGAGYYNQPAGIAVDQAGYAYVVGMTTSANFPTTANAFQRRYPQANRSHVGEFAAFVMKLTPNGVGVPYSTYLSGTYNTFGAAIAIDNSGNAYVTGTTATTGDGKDDFP